MLVNKAEMRCLAVAVGLCMMVDERLMSQHLSVTLVMLVHKKQGH